MTITTYNFEKDDDCPFSDDDFVRGMQAGYREAIIFTDCGPDDSKEMQNANFSDELSIEIDAVCEQFYQENKELLRGCRLHPDQCGHDLWLTRNGHGAGFWDRGLGEKGQKLTDACKNMGAVDLFAGEDGEIYSEGGHAYAPAHVGGLEIEAIGNTLKLSVPEAVNRYAIFLTLKERGELSVWAELLEPYFINGSYYRISPESHIVGLTSDPYLLAEEAEIQDNGDLIVYGKLYHYPDYMVKSVCERLALGNPVFLAMFHDAGEKGELLKLVTVRL